MKYKAEASTVKMKVKHTIKAGSPEEGFLHFKKWADVH